jgi:phosphatidylethanolamine N-methyltransferase
MNQILQQISEIDFLNAWVVLAASAIAFNPTFWNVAARAEYHRQSISKWTRSNKYHGCLALAFCVFTLGVFRDWLYGGVI